MCIVMCFYVLPQELYAQYQEYEVVTDGKGNRMEIDVPKSFTFEVDSLLELYHAKTYLKADSDCSMMNYDPETDRETFIERLRRMPTIMEMPYNEEVSVFIKRYTKYGRKQLSYLLGAANFYMPIFEQALEVYGLPLELRYLPVIESGLNPVAVSRSGATGLWQLMLATAKQYGLEINSLVDERRDPVKSSYAAAQFLSDLYRIYNDWYLVIAAYNCGPERVNKAIHRSGGGTDDWKIYPYLPKETRGYVPAFIAANYAMNYYCEHKICPMRTDLPMTSDTVMVDKDIHFSQISGVLGIDIEHVKALNPQYRKGVVNGSSGPAPLRLPSSYVGRFIDNEDSIARYNACAIPVKRSEVEVPKLGNTRTAQQSVKPTGKQTERTSRQTAGKSVSQLRTNGKRQGKSSASQSVKIKQGQTLSEIARQNNTTVDKIRKLNNIKGDNIRAGNSIRVR